MSEKSNRTGTVCLLVVLGIVLTACTATPHAASGAAGHSDTSPASVPSGAAYAGDPCAVLAAADFSATGLTLSKTDKLSAKNCLYYLDGGTVNVFVESASDYTVNKSLLSDATAVQGVGDEAYRGTEPGGGTVYGTRAGATGIRLATQDGHVTDQQLTFLSETAAGHVQ